MYVYVCMRLPTRQDGVENRDKVYLSFLSFPTRGLGWFVNQRNPSGYWQVTKGHLSQIILPFTILFCLGLAFS